MANKIEVRMIWAAEKDMPEAFWLVDAWDEWSIDGNYDGWEKAVEKAEAENHHVRITVSQLDLDAITAAFQPTTVAESQA